MRDVGIMVFVGGLKFGIVGIHEEFHTSKPSPIPIRLQAPLERSARLFCLEFQTQEPFLAVGAFTKELHL